MLDERLAFQHVLQVGYESCVPLLHHAAHHPFHDPEEAGGLQVDASREPCAAVDLFESVSQGGAEGVCDLDNLTTVRLELDYLPSPSLLAHETDDHVEC